MPIIKTVCKRATVRSLKAVRLNLETIEGMFNNFTNLRVIQVVRDPRAVALSRMQHSTYHGRLSGSIETEAKLYCSEVLEDLAVKKRIEKRFPGRIMQVVYEHVVSNPVERIQQIYSFLNETVTNEVKSWLIQNTQTTVMNSSEIARRWKDNIKFTVAKQVSENCAELYRAVSFELK